MCALVFGLIATGRALGGDRGHGGPRPQHLLQRVHPVGGWHPYGGGLLRWGTAHGDGNPGPVRPGLDVDRRNLRDHQPVVELASARVADHFRRPGPSGTARPQETSRVLCGRTSVENLHWMGGAFPGWRRKPIHSTRGTPTAAG